jgi:phosphopantothenoylcysteine decarboxylase/phosphopantothenate--cysteine ligase
MATDKPVLIAPAMNVKMWEHPATQRNLAVLLQGDGIRVVGPEDGAMACGEFGPGRMSEVPQIIAAIEAAFGAGPLSGRHVLVTSGPTHEPIDPVRYIANRSSGAQGTALAAALRDLGARVSFVTGPASVPPPPGVDVIAVETAAEMADGREGRPSRRCGGLRRRPWPTGAWRTRRGRRSRRMRRQLPSLSFAENPDILASVAQMGEGRPALVVGFAAETQDVERHATEKRARKGCDWIVANDVSPGTGIMGGTENAVTLITEAGAEEWPRLSKAETARRLAARIAGALA